MGFETTQVFPREFQLERLVRCTSAAKIGNMAGVRHARSAIPICLIGGGPEAMIGRWLADI